MADFVSITSDITDGITITTNVIESTTVTANVVTGGKGDTGATGAPGANGAPGVVQAIVAGNNIDVDNTDPANPIVSVENLTLSDITDVTASATELNYTDGVTSNIQTQLDNKQPLDADLTALAAANNSTILSATTASFTTADETKLDGIAAGAEVNVNADWNAASGDAQILNKPTIPTQYTDELAQDAVGTILTDSSEIDLTYNDSTPSITASIVAGSIDETKLDASTNASLDLADTSLQPNASITQLDATAHRTFYSDASGNVTLLAHGTSGQVLTSNGASSAPSWSTPSGSGDVVGPASSTDNALVRFDGTTGKLIKDSAVTASDAELNILDGATLTTTELNYVDGVTSAIQTQIDSKANDSDVVHDTGAETIAGVKTFSSDPIIPDEAYGVGWNGSLEPPTKNAVYDKIETLASGGITRSVVSVTGSTTLGSSTGVDYVALIGASGAPTLPTAVSNTNLYTLVNVDTTNKTIATTSSQTINGDTTVTLTPDESITVISDNSNWHII